MTTDVVLPREGPPCGGSIYLGLPKINVTTSQSKFDFCDIVVSISKTKLDKEPPRVRNSFRNYKMKLSILNFTTFSVFACLSYQ